MLDAKISDLQNSIDSSPFDDADLAVMKSTLQETQSALQTAQDEFTQKSWDTKISSLEAQISQYEEELRSIQTELTSTSAQSEFRVKVDVLKTDLTKKTQARNVLINSNAERFRELLGFELTSAAQESQINVLVRRKNEDMEEAEQALDCIKKEALQNEAKSNTCKEQIRDKRKEKNHIYSKIMDTYEIDRIDEFPDVVKQFEESVADFRVYGIQRSG